MLNMEKASLTLIIKTYLVFQRDKVNIKKPKETKFIIAELEILKII